MRLELPVELKLVHEMRIPVRWGDLDSLGHLNNAMYLRFFESLRVDWLLTLHALPDLQGVGPVVANAFCNFLRPINFPGDVLARHYVRAPGTKSLDTYFTFAVSDAPDVVVANGGATLVWMDLRSGRTVALPHDVRAACA